MIRSSLMASLLGTLLFASSASAVTTTINDGYHGGTANNPFWLNQDIVGLAEHWDISKMDVSINEDGQFVISIFSQYFDNVGRLGVELGDLFMSIDGWNPFGTGPYDNDDASNGEDWEIVAVLDDHGEAAPDSGTSYLGQSGVLDLYRVNTANIELSNLPGHDYRVGQEVQYNPDNQQAFTQGRWRIVDIANDPYDVLQLAFNLGPDFVERFTSFGFHWSMTCGNDVIEGAADVPEPATVALMGMGLLGMLPRVKRAKK